MKYDYAQYKNDKGVLSHIVRLKNQADFNIARKDSQFHNFIISKEGKGEFLFIYKNEKNYESSQIFSQPISAEIDKLKWINDLLYL